MDRQYRPVFFLVSVFLQGCGPQYALDQALDEQNGTAENNGEGGGTDVIVANMPFAKGYGSRCVQGANGSYSHQYTSTKYDLDFDTPNDTKDLIYAPMSGTAYVHDDGTHGFGRHVNLDLHDGTYLIMGHMSDVFIQNGTDVAAGQILGFEGTTGNSTGDHVHFGRHSGDAKKAGSYGASLSGLKVRMFDVNTNVDADVMTSDATCSLSGGHLYKSELPTAHWHPVGTFLKRPGDSLVFERVTGNGVLAYMNENAFLSRGYSFTDVALMSDEELACYSRAVTVSSAGYVRALRDSSGDAWILIGQTNDSGRKRLRVDETGVVGILQSYGIRASSYDDIDHGADSEISSYPSAGRASYRDGTLVSQEGKSDVYIMNAGVAMPIRDWNTLLLMGFSGRDIIRVTGDELLTNVTSKGNCSTDTYCITKEDITECAHTEEVDDANEFETDSGTGAQGNDDSGGNQDSAVADQAFTLQWVTPNRLLADWITVAGTWTPASGETIGWDPMLAGVHNANSVIYSKHSVSHGDKFRFSMAYGLGSAESWSCLAPFPPGITRGSLVTEVDGVSVSVHTVADPNSAGCQLELVIP